MYTTSRAGRPVWGWMSTGTPRPSSVTLMTFDKTGTEVVFKPDSEMFTDTTEYDYDILHTRMRSSPETLSSSFRIFIFLP